MGRLADSDFTNSSGSVAHNGVYVAFAILYWEMCRYELLSEGLPGQVIQQI